MLASDAEPSVWWGSPVECQSALHRRHREGQLPAALLEQALRRLAGLIDDADVVAPTTRLRERAGRLLGLHPLRAGDALQLAAALAWCEDDPSDETFVALDQRLRDAARREGFAISPA
jgi:predicted nucleic acid-binding protein